ncbi:MAG TPA: glycosyltransferase family 39 protein [Gemmatimonadales bacterium]|nr:glycosyltransferase family 39 protein [Gemmatimonadales bacterium]
MAATGDQVHSPFRPTQREVAVIAALAILVFVLRAVALDADPFSDTDWGFIEDWGNYWKNARLHALWGIWRLDDHNIGLFLTPAYTLAMRAAFALLGVGHAQACLVNALSGTATALLVYALARAGGSPRTALFAGLLMGMNPLAVVYDRSAYPESFQLLFMVLAVWSIVRAKPTTLGAIVGGAMLALAILAKITGLVIIPIVALAWLTRFAASRWLGLSPRFSLRQCLSFAAAAAVVLAGYALLYAWPHRAEIVSQFNSAYRVTGAFSPTGAGARWPDRVALFGWPAFGFRLNGFFRLAWPLVGCTALLGAGRLTRTLRQPLGQVELVCWCWLGFGLLYLGSQYFQPDRRFLFLLPPVAVLSALLLGQRVVIAESAWRSPAMRRVSGAAAGALLAGVAAFYSVPLAVYKVIGLGGHLGRAWDYAAAASVIVTTAVVLGAAAGALAIQRLRWSPSFGHYGALAAVAVTLALLHWGRELKHRLYGMRNVAAAIARLTNRWPPAERVMVGWSAPTLVMGTQVIGASFELKEPRAVERFEATLESYAGTPGRPVRMGPIWQRPDRPVKLLCGDFPIFPDAKGAAGIMIHLYVVPNHLEECRAAVRAVTGLPRAASHSPSM